MERQEHLMTKSFPPSTPTSNPDDHPPQPQNPPSQTGGDFFTWELTRPSPRQDNMDVAEDLTGHHREPGGGHLLHFDNNIPHNHHQHHQQSTSPDDGTLSEPASTAGGQSEVGGSSSYQLDLPSENMYKFGFEDGDEMGMHMGEEMARRLGDGDGGGDGGGDEMGGPEIGGFVIHGDFGDPYMNGVLGKFDRGLGGHWEMVFVLMRNTDYGHGDTFENLHDYERLYKVLK